MLSQFKCTFYGPARLFMCLTNSTAFPRFRLRIASAHLRVVTSDGKKGRQSQIQSSALSLSLSVSLFLSLSLSLSWF